jgi:HSP20 family protein
MGFLTQWGFSPITRDDFFSPVSQEMDRLFNEVFGKKFLSGVQHQSNCPRMNVYEKDGKLIMEAAVAGIPEDDIHVSILSDGILEISGKVDLTNQKDTPNYLIHELSTSFKRQLRLPDSVLREEGGDILAPEATLKDGILTIVFTLSWFKTPKEPEVKKIEIKKEYV